MYYAINTCFTFQVRHGKFTGTLWYELCVYVLYFYIVVRQHIVNFRHAGKVLLPLLHSILKVVCLQVVQSTLVLPADSYPECSYFILCIRSTFYLRGVSVTPILTLLHL